MALTHSTRRPRVVYHYTSAQGLLGVLGAGAVWASDTRFMNDSAELKLAINAMLRRVKKRMTGLRRGENRAAIEMAMSMAAQSGFSAYVASFTEDGDLLSQWRAYAPRDGVAIGFFSAAMQTIDGFQFARCEYIDEFAFEENPLPQRLTPIARALDRCVRRLAHLRRPEGPRDAFATSVGDLRHQYKLELVHCLLHHAIWLKHRGFAEEREWRLARYEPAYLYPTEPPEEFKPQFRAGGLGVTPYLSARLPAKHRGKPLGLAEIILGPSPNGEASASAVREMLQARFNLNVPARWCRLPYRGW